MSLKRYFGAICKKHPSREGERLSSNRTCLDCNKENMRARRAANPEYHKAAARASFLKNRDKYLARSKIQHRQRYTGMDNETYVGLLALQGNKCAICRRDIKGRSAHADHCHETKEPRGILCPTCNQAEGLIKRSGLEPQAFGLLLRAYLDNPPAKYLRR